MEIMSDSAGWEERGNWQSCEAKRTDAARGVETNPSVSIKNTNVLRGSTVIGLTYSLHDVGVSGLCNALRFSSRGGPHQFGHIETFPSHNQL
jgi:hypothetical protein